MQTTPSVVLILWGFKKVGDPDKVGPLLKTYLEHGRQRSQQHLHTVLSRQRCVADLHHESDDQLLRS